jgi:hypothetical protein
LPLSLNFSLEYATRKVWSKHHQLQVYADDANGMDEIRKPQRKADELCYRLVGMVIQK